MIIAKMAKNAITMRNDIDVLSRDPHVPRLLLFLLLDEPFDFFTDSFEYIFFNFIQFLWRNLPRSTNNSILDSQKTPQNFFWLLWQWELNHSWIIHIYFEGYFHNFILVVREISFHFNEHFFCVNILSLSLSFLLSMYSQEWTKFSILDDFSDVFCLSYQKFTKLEAREIVIWAIVRW